MLCSGTENCQVTIGVSVLADGMAGQVSPEALFSRLQTEGSKTEAESEVRAQNYFRPKLRSHVGCLFTQKRQFQPLNASSRVESWIKKRARSQGPELMAN